MNPPIILECSKTGRVWRLATAAEAQREAYVKGLTDYTIGRAKE